MRQSSRPRASLHPHPRVTSSLGTYLHFLVLLRWHGLKKPLSQERRAPLAALAQPGPVRTGLSPRHTGPGAGTDGYDQQKSCWQRVLLKISATHK